MQMPSKRSLFFMIFKTNSIFDSKINFSVIYFCLSKVKIGNYSDFDTNDVKNLKTFSLKSNYTIAVIIINQSEWKRKIMIFMFYYWLKTVINKCGVYLNASVRWNISDQPFYWKWKFEKKTKRNKFLGEKKKKRLKQFYVQNEN